MSFDYRGLCSIKCMVTSGFRLSNRGQSWKIESTKSFKTFKSSRSRSMERVKFVSKVFSYVVRGGCALHVVQSQFYEFTETRGESMLPTLAAQGDFVFSSKRYKLGRNLEIGDCIVALKPTDPEQRVCKRISGMPGDLILVDPSLQDGDQQYNRFIKVPDGHCWVTGDNLAHSLDSRTYNSLPLGLIKGKIIAAVDFNKDLYSEGKVYGFRWILNNLLSDED